MIEREIKNLIEVAIKNFTKDLSAQAGDLNFSVEIPSEKSHGDYSTNVALFLAKQVGKNPVETANLIKDKIDNKIFKKIEIAGPGFINFFIADKVFIDALQKVNKDFGKNKELKGKKIAVEYTDPNPFKEFHIGHLMSNSIGESLSRILEFHGARVKRFCYQGDIGMHVAKAIWGKMKHSDKTWGQAYAYASHEYLMDGTAMREIVDINTKVYKKSDSQINKLYDEGKKKSLEHFDKIYKTLGTKFDYFIFESQVVEAGKKIVEDNLKKGIFEKGENGAVIFKGENVGLHTRVFINAQGIPTYEAKDLALPSVKYKYFSYDTSIIATANEQNEYFKVMLAALKQIDSKLAEKTRHIGHGLLRLPDGKMSSRKGSVITGESLIEQVKDLVKEKIKEKDLPEEEKTNIYEAVAVGAIKYSILRQSIGSDIIYDFDKSISFEGDSGPYLQYSYTRAQSVLKKAGEEKIKPSFKNVPEQVSELEKKIVLFEEVVLQSGKHYNPHHLVIYLTDLAGTFNAYYAKNKIVDKSDNLSSYKVALTEAFSLVMQNGLWLLGIKTLNKM